MAYSQNPYLPHVRMEAVRLVRAGWSTVKVARHMGYSQGAISKWVQRAPSDLRMRVIPTESSRPHHHAHELSPDLVRTIITYRQRYRRCAFVFQHLLRKDDYDVSLSSVKRTLRRNELTRFSKWKKWHRYPPRPVPERPGILVEIDTIHDGAHDNRLYVYTLLDVYSRWAYAVPSLCINTHRSLRFVESGRTWRPSPFIRSNPIMDLNSRSGSQNGSWNEDSLIGIHGCGNQMTMHTSSDGTELFKRSACPTFLGRFLRGGKRHPSISGGTTKRGRTWASA